MAENFTQTNNQLHCSFCKKDNSDVGYLIVGPDNYKICDLCVEEFYECLDNPDYVGIEDDTITCSFCEQGRDKVEYIFPGQDVFICDKCLDTCGEILEEIIQTN